MDKPASCWRPVTLAEHAAKLGGRLVEDQADCQLWEFPSFSRASQLMCLARYRGVEYRLHVHHQITFARTSADIF